VIGAFQDELDAPYRPIMKLKLPVFIFGH